MAILPLVAVNSKWKVSYLFLQALMGSSSATQEDKNAIRPMLERLAYE